MILKVAASALDPEWRNEQTAYTMTSDESSSADAETDLLSRLRDMINRAFGQSLAPMSRSARNDASIGVVPMPRSGRSEGMVPMMRAGRSEGMVPMMRAGRSEGMVPMARAGRSEGMVPMMRAGRSEGMVPMMRAGRSDGIVPFPRAGRSDGMLPMLRAGRSDNADGMVPMPRAGRSEGMVPMMRAGRSEGMLPMMRAGRSDGLVPMARAGRSDGMLPLMRAGRSVSSAGSEMHVRSRRSIPVMIIERASSSASANESNADARSNKSTADDENDSAEDLLDDISLLVDSQTDEDDEDELTGMKRFPRQIIPLPRVGRRSDPSLKATAVTVTAARRSHRIRHLLLPHEIHILTPLSGLASSASLDDGSESGYYDDPIDLQLRAMYIPRFGKRSFSALSPILKKGGNKGTFQPRIGRGSFQPRVGRAGEGWLMADDADYLTLDDLMDMRSLRAFQPRIGRSAGKSSDSSKDSVSGKN